MNFLSFIKDESSRSIQKLYAATSKNLKDKSISEQINIKNPFVVNSPENKNLEQRISKPNEKNNFEVIYKTKKDIQPIVTAKIGLINLE